jgi:tetratricopeptide (TPR) repeat protein
MRPNSRRPLVTLAAIALLAGPARLVATCGGGGGGGEGGFGESMPVGERVYHVPWTVLTAGTAAPTTTLTLLWFPTSPGEAQVSPLQSSRRLTSWAGDCVGMAIVPAEATELRTRYHATDAPFAVIAGPDGGELARVEAAHGRLELGDVEKAVSKTLDGREDADKAALDAARDRAKAKDVDGAATLYQQVYGDRCLFSKLAKKAAKALEELGRPVPAEASALWNGPAPDLSDGMNHRMQEVMEGGLTAELAGRIPEAQAAYERARGLDAGDPVPLRFLAELHRHHTGDWDQARTLFTALLARPADPLTRAVALHGLGKMTIHSGGYAEGLALFERSLQAFPLALTYRNLAVYWASEHQPEKAFGYVEKALALAPRDEYNLIFAATQYVALGRQAEAETVAAQHRAVVSASYNLAAIEAQLGHRDRALELLHRHFYVYEQFDAVRRREMQEARDDVVFASLHHDPAFVALTKLADGHGMAGSAGTSGGTR